ncbi:hypothetical protein [Burkholderia stagnalis]|uniref:hypothetical protein n=1 Tax=Burkholderia stagnalis TaxID=1503054 RepID=UPI000759572A|nr:hypothetical protein [Burkholderia stagnalis]KVL90754.1 hypothetical protein WT02_23075 [Burkholderia stagnalis]KVL93746.1 hypothetical protein WT03_14980 [Burkholderia stagnalis]KVM02169.1 hypothetical protein WT04_30740 [Burkholderia stagnalis]
MLTAYIGATFRFAGALQKDGASGDFTGATLSAVLYDAAGTTQISALSVEWIDAKTGLFQLTAGSTAGWMPQKARIDCRLSFPTGDVVLGPPIYIRIAQSTLS